MLSQRWSVTLAVGVCLLVGAGSPGVANPGRRPGPATVAVVHSEHILLPKTLWTPDSVYPLGKQDYGVIARMLDRAAMLATGTTRINDSWLSVLSPTDRVGILIDAQSPPVSLALVDAVIDRIVRVGVRPARITVWAEDEQSLFSAGLLVRKDPEGISALGADSEGFLGGASRIISGQCDVLINVARLRPDSRIGLWGAVANHLACVPRAERLRLLSNQEDLPAAAARPATKMKFKLHILDALQPNYEPGPLGTAPFWECGKLLAGVDPVALDVVGKQILEEKRAAVSGEARPLDPAPAYLESATATHRLGQCDPAKITLRETDIGEATQ